jgi:hypothetical protein
MRVSSFRATQLAKYQRAGSSAKRPFIVPAQCFGIGASHNVVRREDRLAVKLAMAAMRKEVSIEEYRRRIAKRMQSLERSEHAAIAPGRGRCGLRFPALRLVLDAKDEEGPVPPRQHGGIGEGADILADLTQIGIVDLELEPCILAGLPEQTIEKGAGLVN